MTKRLELPKFQAFDANGDPLSGGLVYTYSAGTTTLKTTYSDYDASTPNANPVVLDSRGEADIYVQGSCKIVLQDSAGTTIWTLDNVQGGVGADAGGEDFYYPEATAADQGVTGSSDTIKYAVDTIGSNNGSIYLRHNSGSDVTEYNFSTTEIIPKSITLIIEIGAVIKDDSSNASLTINGSIDAGLYKIFDWGNGTGTLTIGDGAVPEVYPEWCGADNTGVNNSFDSVQESYAMTGKNPFVFTNGTYLVTGDSDVIDITDSDRTIIVKEGATIVKDGTNSFIRLSGSASKTENTTIDVRGTITVPTVGSSTNNAGVQIGAGTAREYGVIRIPNLNTIGMGQYGLSTGSQAMFVDRLELGYISCTRNGTTSVNVLSDPVILKPGSGVDTSSGYISVLVAGTIIADQEFEYAVAPVGSAAGKIQYVLSGSIGEIYAKGGTETTFAFDHANLTVGLLDVESTDADGLQISGQTTTDLFINTLHCHGTPTGDISVTLGSTGSNGVVIDNAKLSHNIQTTTNGVHDSFVINSYVGGKITAVASGSKITNGVFKNINATGPINIIADDTLIENAYITVSTALDTCKVVGDDNVLRGIFTYGTTGVGNPVEIEGDNNLIIDSFQRPNGAAGAYYITSGTGNVLRNAKSTLTANIYDSGTDTEIYDCQIDEMSADKGDLSFTALLGKTEQTILYNSELNFNRTITLSTTGATNGGKFHVVRTANSTGAVTLSVGGLIALDPGEWATVMYSGSAWVLIGYGSLS